uniref:cyclin-P3-1 isoform X1 n=1 Tax=Erigeron canadensis TaxID=72917 RepID=UPI001CB9902F|nr:cyclin-P3-1 isoform X1 [Erigeron canadensis]
MDTTRNSSPCLDTKALTPEDGICTSKLYVTLGLEGGTGSPKILSLLSSLLQESVEKNETLLQTTQRKDVLTIFHGSKAPSLTIQQYMERIFKYSRCSPSCFIVAHIYIQRLIQSENIMLTSLTVHRLLITSILLATKFIDEAFYNNAYYAKVGGVTTAEMNRLEMKFLFAINFQLHVNLNTFRKYCIEVISEASREQIQVDVDRPLYAINSAYSIKDNWSKNESKSSFQPTIEVHIK